MLLAGLGCGNMPAYLVEEDIARGRLRPTAPERHPLSGPRREVGAGARSGTGRDSRDAFLDLAETCHTRCIAVSAYLGSRLRVGKVPR
jgi:DNA-binding transcriptional LysR family regulator